MMKTNNHQQAGEAPKNNARRKVEAVGWGLFFIWIGIAILADVGWGIGLIGIGVLILGLRVADAYLSNPDGCRGSQGRY